MHQLYKLSTSSDGGYSQSGSLSGSQSTTTGSHYTNEAERSIPALFVCCPTPIPTRERSFNNVPLTTNPGNVMKEFDALTPAPSIQPSVVMSYCTVNSGEVLIVIDAPGEAGNRRNYL